MDVAEGGVLQEGHLLRQRVSPRRKAHLDLKQVNKSIYSERERRPFGTLIGVTSIVFVGLLQKDT